MRGHSLYRTEVKDNYDDEVAVHHELAKEITRPNTWPTILGRKRNYDKGQEELEEPKGKDTASNEKTLANPKYFWKLEEGKWVQVPSLWRPTPEEKALESSA